MGESFKFVYGEIGAEVITEGRGEVSELWNGKVFFGDFVFDANENFLLAGATGKVAICSTMSSAGEAESLLAVNSILGASFKDSVSPTVIENVFV